MAEYVTKVVCDMIEPALVTIGLPLASSNVIAGSVDMITVGINGITAVRSAGGDEDGIREVETIADATVADAVVKREYVETVSGRVEAVNELP